MVKTLIFGGSGQVSRALQLRLPDAAVAGSTEADFTQPETVLAALEKYRPEIILNTAAYTAVDKAESEELAALQVNGLTPGVIAEWAAKHDALLVHYSTDYVFDGSGGNARNEAAPTAPLSAYGRTKLMGEREIAKAGGRYFIFRLCWVYDEDGKNFLNTMLRLGADREQLSVVADQIGAPTYAGDIAEATLQAMAKPDAPSGIYHFCNSGETSWHGFALAIFEEAAARGQAVKVQEVKAIATADYPTPAKRPLNSRLDCRKFREVFGWAQIPDWRSALNRCMARKFPG